MLIMSQKNWKKKIIQQKCPNILLTYNSKNLRMCMRTYTYCDRYVRGDAFILAKHIDSGELSRDLFQSIY